MKIKKDLLDWFSKARTLLGYKIASLGDRSLPNRRFFKFLLESPISRHVRLVSYAAGNCSDGTEKFLTEHPDLVAARRKVKDWRLWMALSAAAEIAIRRHRRHHPSSTTGRYYLP